MKDKRNRHKIVFVPDFNIFKLFKRNCICIRKLKYLARSENY